MKLQRIGGFAALCCAATYLIGFAFLGTVLAPLGYGTHDIDPRAVTAFIAASPSTLIAFNTIIYILNAVALVVLVIAFDAGLAKYAKGRASLVRAFGLIWAALVLGAGMIGNVAVERAAHIYPVDPIRASEVWETLHFVELGLGGGNEIAGGVWIFLASLMGYASKSVGKIATNLGVLTGISGLATVFPPTGDFAGAVFGLGAIAWFVAIGLTFARD